jgi:hypothetical protein
LERHRRHRSALARELIRTLDTFRKMQETEHSGELGAASGEWPVASGEWPVATGEFGSLGALLRLQDNQSPMGDEWPMPEVGTGLQPAIDREEGDKTEIPSHDGACADEGADAIGSPSREGAEGDETEFLPHGAGEADGMGIASDEEAAAKKLPKEAKTVSPKVDEAKEVESQKRLEAACERSQSPGSGRRERLSCSITATNSGGPLSPNADDEGDKWVPHEQNVHR